MTESEAVKVVALLSAAFPRQAVDDDTADVYATFLGDLDVAHATAAVKRLVTTSRFFPTIAEIREAVAELAAALPSEQAALAAVASKAAHRPEYVPCPSCPGSFGEIDGRLCDTCHGEGRVDRNPSPALHPFVKRALDAVGGLSAFRASENPGVFRAQLRDAYRDIRSEAIYGVQTGERPALAPIEKLAALPTVTLRPIE